MNQAWLYRLLHLYLSFKNGEWGVWTLDLKLEKALFRESVILKFYDFFLTKISSFQNKETGVCWIYKFTEFKTQEKLEINLFCGCCLVSKLCLTFFFYHQMYRLWPARLLCPWDFPGKNTGVGCHFLLQGVFLTQELNLHILHCK